MNYLMMIVNSYRGEFLENTPTLYEKKKERFE